MDEERVGAQRGQLLTACEQGKGGVEAAEQLRAGVIGVLLEQAHGVAPRSKPAKSSAKDASQRSAVSGPW